MITLTHVINMKPIEQFTDQFRDLAGRVIRMTAFMIEGDAKLACPVDTGALRASIYTSTAGKSGYEKAIVEAETVYWSNKVGQDTSKGMPLSEAAPVPDSLLTAIVAVGMSYGIYLEKGTTKMPAKPFLGPAADGQRDFFRREMAKAIADAAKSTGWTQS